MTNLKSFFNLKNIFIKFQNSKDPSHVCELICEAAQLSPEEFRLGNTKIFIRSPESLFLLEEARERRFDAFARIIQRIFKKFAAKRNLKKQKVFIFKFIFKINF
jgi:myosin I